MQLLNQHKKKFFVISGLLLVLAIVGTLLDALLSSINSTVFMDFLRMGVFLKPDFERIINMAWRLISRNFLSVYLPIWLGIFLGALGNALNLACFGAGSFHSAKTGKRSVFTVIGAVLMILGAAFSLIFAGLSVFIPAMSFSWANIASWIFNVPLTFVLAVYLIIFGFVKPKGSAIPIIGAILIVLTGTVVSATQIIPAIISLFSNPWPFMYNLFGFIGSVIGIVSTLCLYFGLLLHVPLAYYQPKVTEEIPETIMEIEEN